MGQVAISGTFDGELATKEDAADLKGIDKISMKKKLHKVEQII
jgi:hypothetical protein